MVASTSHPDAAAPGRIATASPGHRKSGFGADDRRPGIEVVDGVWHLRSFAACRQVLRDADRTRQGATTDNVLVRRLRPSVISQVRSRAVRSAY